jgi:hypothetical protein
MTFDSDYRKKHNDKYHSEMVKACRHIPYKLVGASDSLFAFAQQKPKTTVPETASEQSTSTPPQSEPTPTLSKQSTSTEPQSESVVNPQKNPPQMSQP